MRNILLDAGPQIALFAPDDSQHKRCRKVLESIQAEEGLRLQTTWPCIVEASYLLHPRQRFELLRWVELGGVQVYPFEPHHLADMLPWMEQYTERGKREMDLADASLYWLSVETGVIDILTVDVADFSRYRLPDGRVFNLL